MKKEVTYIDACKFESIISGMEGLTVTVQKGFVKVSAKKGVNIYIAKTAMVGRVDISGFKYEGPGVVDLGDQKFGAVEQQLDFSKTEPEILETFLELLTHMMTLEERKVVRTRASSSASSAVGWSFGKATSEATV